MTRSRQHLTLALLVSLLLHLTMLVAPGWVLPVLEDAPDAESPSPIEAHLTTPAIRRSPVSAARPAPVKGQRRQISKPGIVAVEAPPEGPRSEPAAISPPAAETQQRLADAAELKSVAVEPVAPISAAAPESPLPRRGRIRFIVTRGDQGFVIGQSLHRWSHDGKTYALDTVTETTGLAAVFKPVQVTQSSTGEIGEEGLRPREFRTGKNGLAGDAASFDWPLMTLMLSAGNPHNVALKPGAQDMLSMFYQLSAKYPLGPRDVNEVMVATGRKFERYVFAVLGEEKLPTPQGELRTLHLRAAVGVEAIDVWSGVDLRGLPVKIRYTDRDGESFDQIAEAIEYEGMTSLSAKQ